MCARHLYNGNTDHGAARESVAATRRTSAASTVGCRGCSPALPLVRTPRREGNLFHVKRRCRARSLHAWGGTAAVPMFAGWVLWHRVCGNGLPR